MDRRDFLKYTASVSAVSLLTGCSMTETVSSRETSGKRPNILLIIADDMNYDSLGVSGCSLLGITPNLDRLASEGIRFEHAHVMTAICSPSRAAIMTGRYPHCTGYMGHGEAGGRLPRDVWDPEAYKTRPPLSAYLHEAGYLTGIFCKGGVADDIFDIRKTGKDFGWGRVPSLFYTHTKIFFDRAKGEGQPFFLNVNPQDPHRYWARTKEERNPVWVRQVMGLVEDEDIPTKYENGLPWPDPKTNYKPDEIPVPAFLADTPENRRYIAPYYNSVNRFDECAGEILRALRESGLENNTIIVFLSDQGMGSPYAKWSCYPYGTKTPLIIKWPGRIAPGRIDADHIVSSIDLLPTLVEAVGLPSLYGVDGRSLMPILDGKTQISWRQSAYTCFNYMNYPEYYPMRAMIDQKYVYIWNAWSGGDNQLPASQTMANWEPNIGIIGKNAKVTPKLAERIRFYKYRVPEEFYDIQDDPGCWENLIAAPEHQVRIQVCRHDLLAVMKSSKDPELNRFQRILARQP